MENILYLCSNAFRIYIMFRFGQLLFGNQRVNKFIIFFFYGLYFALNTLAYFIYESPTVNIITNLVPFFLISFLYNSKLSTKFITVFGVFALAMFIGLFVLGISLLVSLNPIILNSSIAFDFTLFFVYLIFKKKYKPIDSIDSKTSILYNTYITLIQRL